MGRADSDGHRRRGCMNFKSHETGKFDQPTCARGFSRLRCFLGPRLRPLLTALIKLWISNGDERQEFMETRMKLVVGMQLLSAS